jgi:hypothetical protein
MREQCDSLDGFSKTHFVSQNAVNALIIKIIEPSQSLKLVFFQFAMEVCWRFDQLLEGLLIYMAKIHCQFTDSDCLTSSMMMGFVVTVKLIHITAILIYNTCYVFQSLAFINLKFPPFESGLLLLFIDSYTQFFGHEMCIYI